MLMLSTLLGRISRRLHPWMLGKLVFIILKWYDLSRASYFRLCWVKLCCSKSDIGCRTQSVVCMCLGSNCESWKANKWDSQSVEQDKSWKDSRFERFVFSSHVKTLMLKSCFLMPFYFLLFALLSWRLWTKDHLLQFATEPLMSFLCD